MKDLDAWLKAQEASATDKFAIGPEKFSEMLKATEKVDVPLAQVKEIGERDLERNLAALKEACDAFAAGETIEKCVAKAQADKPQGSPVDAARRQLIDLRSFIEAKQVVTIPGPEQAKVAESPPYQRWNFAYIDIPGPYETNLPSIYYISPPDPKWPRAEQEAYVPGKNVLLFTSVHEVWPGHFLQYLHANRSPSKFGQVFVGYAFSEGWAHYTEEMMWDAGLGNGDPETHIGQLLEALLRNVRFHFRHWSAHRRHDRRRFGKDVSRAGLSGCRKRPAAGGARHVRSRLSQLHDGQADDPQTARGLDRLARRQTGVEGFSRRVPEVRRPADSAGAQSDVARRPGVVVLAVCRTSSSDQEGSNDPRRDTK